MNYFEKTFPSEFKDVIKWNEIARSTPPTVEQQREYVIEEMITEGNSAKTFIDLLDSIADTFVTASYLSVLVHDFVIFDKAYGDSVRYVVNAVEGYSKELVQDCIIEVMRSNYTKYLYCEHLDASDILSQVHILEDLHNCKVKVRLINDYAVFLNDETNKVLKPTTYEAPDLKSVLDKYGLEDYELDGE